MDIEEDLQNSTISKVNVPAIYSTLDNILGSMFFVKLVCVCSFPLAFDGIGLVLA